MRKNRNSFPEEERLENKVISKFGNEEELLESYEDPELEEIPDDLEDQRRRLRVMMQQLREQGHLTAEEEEKLFGPGGYLDDTEASEELTPVIKNLSIKTGKRKRFSYGKLMYNMRKAAAVMVVVVGGILVVAFSSEANRKYVSDMATYTTGGDIRVKESGGGNIKIRTREEENARAKIKEELNITIPVLDYKPVGMKFTDYEVFKDSAEAYMFYELDECSLVLYMVEGKGGKEKNKNFDGSQVDKLSILYGRAKAEIIEYKMEDKDDTTYTAVWEYDNVHCQFGGKIKKKDLIDILEKISI